MMAAITAAYNGATVVILEKNQRVGKKLLATGNGRCNLSNLQTGPANYHGGQPQFVAAALSSFDPQKTLDFFEYLGITPKIEPDGKVFPHSEQASSVLDLLRYEMEQTGVQIISEAVVTGVTAEPSGLRVTTEGGGHFRADRVVLATGGKAAPQFGSDGSGYVIAQKVGHRLVEPLPALAPLKLQAAFLKRVKGVKFNGRAAVLDEAGQPLAEAAGEILFTEYGASGPPILSLSRTAGACLQNNRAAFLKLTIIEHLSAAQLHAYLTGRLATKPDKSLAFSLVGFINKKLAPVLLQAAGFNNPNQAAGEITARELHKLTKILSDWRFPITGTTSWPNAQTTAGGIDVTEVNDATLESKIIPGLFFAGEILDVDGDCGGYNLQWAWSSGYAAGLAASAAPK